MKKVFYLIQNQEHLTNEGLQKIMALRSSLNFGLSDTLKAAFPSIVAMPRVRFINDKPLDPN